MFSVVDSRIQQPQPTAPEALKPCPIRTFYTAYGIADIVSLAHSLLDRRSPPGSHDIVPYCAS